LRASIDRGKKLTKGEVVKYIVKWDDLYLMDGESPESRSYDIANAKVFSSIPEAEKHLDKIRRFRPVYNYHIINTERAGLFVYKELD